MTKHELSIVRSVLNGMAGPMIVKLLEECVVAEEQAALKSSRAEAQDNVMRAQGARATVNRFVATATEDIDADSGN